jgi:DNA polymerase I-like protein with 3'-5' exonuclease and polymerase domains
MMLYLGTETIWACDTEVADIDLKTVGPVGNGKVVCASVYGGPEVDFGKYGKDKILWIDNAGDAEGVLEEFHDWFLREEAYKVWHNYGFDRHVMYNEGIDCRGFRGDTMHMARLLDSSRDKAVGGGEGYSLASLSADYLGDSKLAKTSMKEIFGVGKLRKDGQESKVKELPNIRDIQLNPDKRDLWIEYSVKDALVTWNLHEVLREQLEEKKWIAMDKKQGNMYDFYIKYLRKFGKILTDMEREGIRIDTQVHLREAETKARAERARLEQVFLNWAAKYVGEEHAKHLNVASTPQIGYFLFGTKEKDESGKLVNVKEKVFKVDKSDEEYAAEVQSMEARNPYAGLTISNMNAMLKERGLKRGTATKAQLMMKLLASDEVQRLKTEALERCADAGLPLDDAPTPRSALSDSMSNDRDCDEDRDLQDMLIARGQFHNGAVQPVTDTMSSADEVTSEAGPGSDDALVEGDGEGEENGRKSRKLKKAKVDKRTAVEIEAEEDAARYLVNMDMIEAIVNSSEKPKRQREVRLKPLLIPPVDLTPKGTPQVSTAVLRKLAGKEVFGPEEAAQWGLAFDFFGKQEKGKEACRALAALADIGQIDTTITNFLVPLQYLVDKNSRIHCSMNLNTETGRLSARRPNLQNQPALEKDQYKIRDAFVAEEGNTLIVADYGQLELRILAHIANCKSMIEAFSSGGCFHSRTAVGMYDHIKQSIADGECILEWDYSKGEKPDVPLVKDKFGSERRKAKTLNFSIAYGKTVHGLAKDWGK